jgi:hypothetical protein
MGNLVWHASQQIATGAAHSFIADDDKTSPACLCCLQQGLGGVSEDRVVFDTDPGVLGCGVRKLGRALNRAFCGGIEFTRPTPRLDARRCLGSLPRVLLGNGRLLLGRLWPGGQFHLRLLVGGRARARRCLGRRPVAIVLAQVRSANARLTASSAAPSIRRGSGIAVELI